MNYRRVLLLRKNDGGGADALLPRMAPAAEVLRIDAREDLTPLDRSAGIDLVVAEQLSVADLPMIAELRKRTGSAVLWIQTAVPALRGDLQVLGLAASPRASAAVAAFLREHGGAEVRARVAAAMPLSDAETIDLVVVPRFPGPLLPLLAQRAPVLVLPPLQPVPLARDIDAPDVIDDRGVFRTTIRYATGVGRLEPIPDQQVELVLRDGVIATVESHDGAAEYRADQVDRAIGIRRAGVTHLEVEFALIAPGSQLLVLFDAAVSNDELAGIARAARDRGIDVLAVRVRPVQSCRSIRARLMRAGLAPRVVDASAVLDEGPALDVGMHVDAVRLARVGAHLRAAGFPVAAIVHCATRVPWTSGFTALRAGDLAAAELQPSALAAAPTTLDERLDSVTGTRSIAGNRIELEIDNAKARRWLLDSIASAKERIHLQLYMAADDDVGRAVESALADAAARGMKVRVVADSLHSMQGSFGMHNPLLERLASHSGVELRLGGPIISPPSVEEFKQRDHRKLVVFDGILALLGGRNLSHEYYSGFDEVPLETRSEWRQVPWLDAGARVEGPAVAALERSFLDAWTAAGGAPYEVVESAPAGSATVRVATHHGLRDVCTLEAYLALIDSARSHVYIVNGFPLVLEIQHALLRALRRGVRVRTLFGNLTPTHAGQAFEGAWSSARVEATNLVRSRMDTLVAAGAEAYELVIPRQARWHEDVGDIHPHVHAKLASVDGRVCSVGSANLDITAGYWESELMLIVEDATLTAALESRIETFMKWSQRINREDPQWQESARHRQWMRHWPGVLSI